MTTLTTKLYLEIESGSLDNNKGDVDRINVALRRALGLQNIRWPLDLMQVASSSLRSSGGRVTITLTIEPNAIRPDTIEPIEHKTVESDRNVLRVIDIETGDTSESRFGLAVDLGTTMVAAELIDLTSGKTLASMGEPNGQIRYGEDLLTRLHFASQGGLNELSTALVETVNILTEKLCSVAGIETSQVSALCAAGNTSMTHFFLGLNPSTLRQAPFVPVINHVPELAAKDIGVRIAPNAATYIFPSVGSYLGGDLIAGALASEITAYEDVSLLLDIGTNGEMILGNKDWLIAGAGAAGPALEGGVAECAGRAEPGAIDQLVIDDTTYEPSFHTIGELPAKTICGSGLVDVIAQLYKSGLLDSTGRFALEKPTDRWKKINGRQAYLIREADQNSDLPAIYITDRDIESFMRTKAAMVAALTVLLESVGLRLEGIKHVYTAGSFGLHVSVESATTIGLYPRLPENRFIPLGNGSLKGACEILLDAGKIAAAEKIADRITYLELSVNPAFMRIFRSAKYI